MALIFITKIKKIFLDVKNEILYEIEYVFIKFIGFIFQTRLLEPWDRALMLHYFYIKIN